LWRRRDRALSSFEELPQCEGTSELQEGSQPVQLACDMRVGGSPAQGAYIRLSIAAVCSCLRVMQRCSDGIKPALSVIIAGVPAMWSPDRSLDPDPHGGQSPPYSPPSICQASTSRVCFPSLMARAKTSRFHRNNHEQRHDESHDTRVERRRRVALGYA
jgi:hypothetical protein